MVVFLVLISLLIHSTVFILTGPLKCLCGRIHITFQAPPAFTFICHDQISRRTRQVCNPAELLGSVKAGCGAEAFIPTFLLHFFIPTGISRSLVSSATVPLC